MVRAEVLDWHGAAVRGQAAIPFSGGSAGLERLRAIVKGKGLQ
jgi:hypothetical protein